MDEAGKLLQPANSGEIVIRGANVTRGYENNPAANEMNAELEDAIVRGFEYLKSVQNSDGSFGRGRYGKHVGITALCALAYMADGNLPGRGEYGEQGTARNSPHL